MVLAKIVHLLKESKYFIRITKIHMKNNMYTLLGKPLKSTLKILNNYLEFPKIKILIYSKGSLKLF
jgi:hypothetical protein